MIVTSALLDRLESPGDRRELRNFMRFLRLWPKHQPDMLRRPRWQKYLALTQQEAEQMSRPTHWRCPRCEHWHEFGPGKTECTSSQNGSGESHA